ncbi:hypothetical protein [Rhizobium sp. Rhizsp42]|uniref:hypothetical protein n=1 Tax=Rhizobium sp. Rhizsp42 TaxID=3243034 RepID=UPI0013AFB897
MSEGELQTAERVPDDVEEDNVQDDGLLAQTSARQTFISRVAQHDQGCACRPDDLIDEVNEVINHVIEQELSEIA